jgi:hypothetical protein
MRSADLITPPAWGPGRQRNLFTGSGLRRAALSNTADLAGEADRLRLYCHEHVHAISSDKPKIATPVCVNPFGDGWTITFADGFLPAADVKLRACRPVSRRGHRCVIVSRVIASSGDMIRTSFQLFPRRIARGISA